MNLEEYEQVLATELPRHVASTWNVMVTDFGAARPNDARVEVGAAIHDQPAGTEESPYRSRVMSVDETTTSITITFHSAPQAPRNVFAELYDQVRATCRALNEARDEFWSVIGQERSVDMEAETPVRALEFTLNIEAQTGVGS